MKPLTQHELIVKYLRTINGWVPAYALEKVTLCGQWIGTRGSRSARDLAEQKKIQRKEGKELMNEGTYTDFSGKPIDKVYVYYKAKAPIRIEHYNAILPDGSKEPFTKTIW